MFLFCVFLFVHFLSALSACKLVNRLRVLFGHLVWCGGEREFVGGDADLRVVWAGRRGGSEPADSAGRSGTGRQGRGGWPGRTGRRFKNYNKQKVLR